MTRLPIVKHTKRPAAMKTSERRSNAAAGLDTQIAELKRIEHTLREKNLELENAVRIRSEFLANMSHELRTPMNGVLGMLDIALDSRLTPDQREHLETAQRCGYSLLDLLNDLLDLAKIESGKLAIDRNPFDLAALLEQSINGHTHKASA